MWLWFSPIAANLIVWTLIALPLLLTLQLQCAASATADHQVARVDLAGVSQAMERTRWQERRRVRLDDADLVVDGHFELAFQQVDDLLTVVGVRLVRLEPRFDDRDVHREDPGHVVRPDEGDHVAVLAQALAPLVPGE